MIRKIYNMINLIIGKKEEVPINLDKTEEPIKCIKDVKEKIDINYDIPNYQEINKNIDKYEIINNNLSEKTQIGEVSDIRKEVINKCQYCNLIFKKDKYYSYGNQKYCTMQCFLLCHSEPYV